MWHAYHFSKGRHEHAERAAKELKASPPAAISHERLAELLTIETDPDRKLALEELQRWRAAMSEFEVTP